MADIDVLVMAAASAACDLKPARMTRRPLGPLDVLIDMKFCGICHSDVHICRGDLAVMAAPNYPLVPGHELAGIVAEVGPAVTRFQVGDAIGVGCMVRVSQAGVWSGRGGGGRGGACW